MADDTMTESTMATGREPSDSWRQPLGDLRLELRARNNRLWHVIHDTHKNVAQFCRYFGLSHLSVGELLNLRRSPYSIRRGQMTLDPTPLARRLCDIVGIGAVELFPPDLYEVRLPRRMIAEVNSERFLSLALARRVALPPLQEEAVVHRELHECFERIFPTLTPREERVIRSRFGFGEDGEEASLDTVANAEGVSFNRIRQIEAKALRKLRHPTRTRELKKFLELSRPDSSPVAPLEDLDATQESAVVENTDTVPAKQTDIPVVAAALAERGVSPRSLVGYEVIVDDQGQLWLKRGIDGQLTKW